MQPRIHFEHQGKRSTSTTTPEFKEGKAGEGDDKAHVDLNPLFEEGGCETQVYARKTVTHSKQGNLLSLLAASGL